MKSKINLIIFSLSIFYLSFGQEATLKSKKSQSYFDISIGKGSFAYSVKISSMYTRTSTDYGLSLKLGTKWKIKEFNDFYKLSFQCNWIRIRGIVGMQIGKYENSTYENKGTILTFDAPILVPGIVNQFRFGGLGIELNYNSGFSAYEYSDYFGIGFITNPEVKINFKNYYLSYDYAYTSILKDFTKHTNLKRSHSSLTFGFYL